jgi:hypothetical protein
MLFYISIFFIPLAIWIILLVISKRKGEKEAESRTLVEECALCHKEFPVAELMEKEVGGYSRVYCFCGSCIEQMYREYQEKSGG